MKWISVEDMPKVGQTVLLLERFCVNDGNYIVVVRRPNGWEDVNGGDDLPDWWEPTHWMPLPEPPKEQ